MLLKQHATDLKTEEVDFWPNLKPSLIFKALISGDDFNEPVFSESKSTVSFSEMWIERSWIKLSDCVDLGDVTVDAIADDWIYKPVVCCNGNSTFGSSFGQWIKLRVWSSSEHNGSNTLVQRKLLSVWNREVRAWVWNEDLLQVIVMSLLVMIATRSYHMKIGYFSGIWRVRRRIDLHFRLQADMLQEIKKMGSRFENIRCLVFVLEIETCDGGLWWEPPDIFCLQTWFLALPFACEAMSSENLFNLSCLFTLDSYLLLLLFLFRYYKDTSS